MDEDEAALLAELRAISNQSSASRFQDDDGGGGGGIVEEKKVSIDNQQSQNTKPQMNPKSTSVLQGGGGNFKQESAFVGDRGGAAEDAELLALLRGVSAILVRDSTREMYGKS